MIESLRATLGLYGATLVIGFVAGMFPLVSIELFLVGCTRWGIAPPVLAVLIALGALGHQIAKSVTYYMGAGALELPKGKIRGRIEAAKARLAGGGMPPDGSAAGWRRGLIERWNKRPKLILFVGAAVGIPPLFLLGFIAQPLMRMSHTMFTAVSLPARLLRLTTLVVAAFVL